MSDSNISGNKNFKNAWLVSGTPVQMVPPVSRVYAEILNESIQSLRVGTSSQMPSSISGLSLPSGCYISDSFSSDDWQALSFSPGSGSVSAFWVEGL